MATLFETGGYVGGIASGVQTGGRWALDGEGNKVRNPAEKAGASDYKHEVNLSDRKG